jgi:hypothetical protein
VAGRTSHSSVLSKIVLGLDTASSDDTTFPAIYKKRTLWTKPKYEKYWIGVVNPSRREYTLMDISSTSDGGLGGQVKGRD